jgi:hypothetical protein
MAEDVSAWFAGRIPSEWFTGVAEVVVDRDEITVIGTLEAPTSTPTTGAAGAEATTAEVASTDDARSAAAAGRIARFREQTRDERIQIAREAEGRFDRKVAWGARCDDTEVLFTRVAVPVMTRLRQPERVVLDTLVDAGVARSRSHALAWCVRLVGEHTGDWLGELRDALTDVERLRNAGPAAG